MLAAVAESKSGTITDRIDLATIAFPPFIRALGDDRSGFGPPLRPVLLLPADITPQIEAGPCRNPGVR